MGKRVEVGGVVLGKAAEIGMVSPDLSIIIDHPAYHGCATGEQPIAVIFIVSREIIAAEER